MFRTRAFLFLATLAAATAMAQSTKKRVAVMDFEYGTVQGSVQAIFGTNQDVGKGIADLLVNNLVNAGAFSVIERKALAKIMAEQNFSNSDRADPASAAKIGKLLGVQAIIVGSITQFGRDDQTTSVGGSVLGGAASRYGHGGIGRRNARAIVGLTARLVSTDTGEILAVATAKGESKRSGATLLGGGGSGGAAAGGLLDMTSKNFGDTILGEAVNEAVTGIGQRMNAESAKITEPKIVIDGLVADVSGNTIIINLGSKAGLKVGDKLRILRTGRTITDPATGQVIRRVEDELGQLVLTSVDETSAEGTFTGKTAPNRGDRVKQ